MSHATAGHTHKQHLDQRSASVWTVVLNNLKLRIMKEREFGSCIMDSIFKPTQVTVPDVRRCTKITLPLGECCQC